MFASLIFVFIVALLTFVNLTPIEDEKFGISASGKEANYCFLPPYPEHGRYIVSNYPSAMPGESYPNVKLDILCDVRYINGNATNSILCINGFWSATMPTCVPCGLISQDRKDEGSSSDHVDLPWHAVISMAPMNMGQSAKLQLYRRGFQNTFATKKTKWPKYIKEPSIYDKKPGPYNYRCGGSIISANKIISAAFCFFDDEKLLPASLFMVVVHKHGSNKIPEVRYSQQYDVVDIKIPSGYQGKATSYKNNIAMVIVERPFIFYPSLRPVCVDFDDTLDRTQLQEGNFGKAFSWSTVDKDTQMYPGLYIVDLPYIKLEDCYDNMSPIENRHYLTKDNFCAASSNGSWSHSYYDRGTGLAFLDSNTQRHYLRGVASFVFVAADNKTNVYIFTSIAKQEHFIKQYL